MCEHPISAERERVREDGRYELVCSLCGLVLASYDELAVYELVDE